MASLFIRSFVCCLCVLVGLSQGLNAAGGDPVGLVVAVRGKATITRNEKPPLVAKLRTPVFVGDYVETDFGGYVQIDFLDGSKTSLAGSSDLTIDAYAYNAETGEAKSEVSIENGALSFMAGEIGKVAPENYKVKTAFATVGIRGSSGEVQVSNGSLPGVPPGIAVQKTGGIGVTVGFAGPDAAPPQVITQSGRGLVMNGGLGTPVQEVAFSGSVVESYSQNTEQRMAAGRAQHKQDQKGGNGGHSGGPHGDSSNALASGDGPGQSKEQPGGQGQPQGQSQGGHGQGQPQDGDQGGPGGPIAGGDAGNDGNGSTLAGGQGPAGGPAGGPNGAPNGPEGGFGGQNPGGPAGEPPMGGTLFGDAGDTGGGMQFQNAPLAGGPPPAPPAPGVGAVNGAINPSALLGDAQGAITAGVETQNETQAQQDPTFNMAGRFVGLHLSGSTLSHVSDSGDVTKPSGSTIASRLIPDLDATLSWDLAGQIGVQMTDSRQFGFSDTEGHSRILTDSRGEFFLGHDYHSGSGKSGFVSHHYGRPIEAGALPATGVRFYQGDLHGSRDGTATRDPWVASSLLVKNDQVLNPGFTSYGVADFRTGRIAGVTTHSECDHWFDAAGNVVDSGNHYYHEGPDYDGRPFTVFIGTLDSSGTISSPKLYHNMGYMPSHVTLPGGLSSASPTWGLQRTLLNDFSGSGQLYGTNAQGFGLSMSGADGDFVAGGIEDTREETLQSLSGTYSGFGRGISVSGPAYDTIEEEKLLSLTLSPDFDAGTLTGGFTIENSGAVSIGTDTLAVDAEIVFGNLSAVSPVAFDVHDDASFLLTMGLPDVYDDTLGQNRAMSSVMWGTWNVVDASAATQVFPGQHNLWVAAIPTVAGAGASTRDKLGVTNNTVYYSGAFAQTLVDPLQHYQEPGKLHLGPGWGISDMNQLVCGPDSNPFSGVGAAGPVVSTVGGHLDAWVHFVSDKFVGIIFADDGTLGLFKGGPGTVSENGFSVDWAPVSLYGQNGGANMFAPSMAAGMSGGFAGSGAEGIYFEYAKAHTYLTETEQVYGVAVGANTKVIPSTTTDTYKAYFHGHHHEFSPASTELLSNPVQYLTYTGKAGGEPSGSFSGQSGGASASLVGSGDTSIFISKDAFFDRFSGSMFDPPSGSLAIDGNNSFMVANHGLDNFDYINWGVWRMQDTGGAGTTIGHWAGGRIQIDGSNDLIPDATALAADANPVVHYKGPAIANYSTSAGMEGWHGEVIMDINFNTAAVSGSVTFPESNVVHLSGTVTGATGVFDGTALLNDYGAGIGDFRGGLYGDEAAGVFGAGDANGTVAGAFGMVTERVIPQVAR